MSAIVRKIETEINTRFDQNGYKLSNTHFEIGRFLHTETYYFAKKYFQNTNNCNDIATLLAEKIHELQLPVSSTLVGYGDYMGLLLRKTIELLPDCNYALVEKGDTGFTWLFLPPLKKNLILILPITSTLSIYIRLQKFLTEYVNSQFGTDVIRVDNDFINIFLVLDESLNGLLDEPIDIESLKDSMRPLYNIYSGFNWTRIDRHKVQISKGEQAFIAHPLVLLYSRIHASEICPICFPENNNLTTEKFLFPTQPNYESPNLIFGFPNFGSSHVNQRDFLTTIASPERDRSVHLHGHIRVKDFSYVNYIRGSAFYEKNKEMILAFFDEVLSRHLDEKDQHIVFISTDNRDKSNFLEDISYGKTLRDRSVTIFCFEPSHEFMDNFISLHSSFLREKVNKVVYFEDVMSAGKTFKLISNYLKHAKDKNDSMELPGIDLVLTLVDRTPYYTRKEIIRKLHSPSLQFPADHFISFFNLNVPILLASHLGNPLLNHLKDLDKIIALCHLDALKWKIFAEVKRLQPRSLHDSKTVVQQPEPYVYFPFVESGDSHKDQIRFNIYSNVYNEQSISLLHLYLSHHLNQELAGPEYNSSSFWSAFDGNPHLFIEILFGKMKDRIRTEISFFFSAEKDRDQYLEYRDEKVEDEIIHDRFIRLLTHNPFIYYRNIYQAIFTYCLHSLDELQGKIGKWKISNFAEFRQLKFYIRRSVELNSNYIVSRKFLKWLRDSYTRKLGSHMLNEIEQDQLELALSLKKGVVDADCYARKSRNIQYRLDQVNSFYLFLLYCYKELIFKNPARSIKLEKLINSLELLPNVLKRQENDFNALAKLLKDPYYQFSTMVKMENIHFLRELKELHKSKLRNRALSRRKDLVNYYFRPNKKNDPVIINAQKLLAESTYFPSIRQRNYIRKAVGNMLSTVEVLEEKNKRLSRDKMQAVTVQHMNTDIKEILDKALTILQADQEGEMNYAFCIEFRKTHQFHSTDNIYTILSNEDPSEPRSAKIDQHGLIFNLLYGLNSSPDPMTEQTIMTAVRSGDQIVSFQDAYYVAGDDMARKALYAVPFETLYKKDFYNPQSETGLKILNEANMTHALRLSQWELRDDQAKEKLQGQAVLVITTTEEATLKNFQKFMDIEKVRLLLLIKEELLEYLERQFESDAFIEVLENRKRETYERKLEHGLNRYLEAQRELFTHSMGTNDPQILAKNKSLFDIIAKIISAQLNFKQLREVKEEIISYPTDQITTRIKDLFASDCFCEVSIPENNYSFEGFDPEYLDMHPSVFDIVIPELVINMKKYSSRQMDNGLFIRYDQVNHTITFNNDIRMAYLHQDINKGYGGINMCREITGKLNLQPLIYTRSDEQFTVVLHLNIKQASHADRKEEDITR